MGADTTLPRCWMAGWIGASLATVALGNVQLMPEQEVLGRNLRP